MNTLKLKTFINYCNQFYNDKTGIYPIADTVDISVAITKYLIQAQIMGTVVEFKETDREGVRLIIDADALASVGTKFADESAPFTIPTFSTEEFNDMCSMYFGGSSRN
tara:strand:- start:33 stop:356 length:324 start_codon:yes stop_codon:yes gene_type:complete